MESVGAASYLPTLFNVYHIIKITWAQSTLERPTSENFRFADDVDGLAGKDELANLVSHIYRASTKCRMEASADGAIITGISAHDQKLETVQQFRYQGAIISDIKNLDQKYLQELHRQ